MAVSYKDFKVQSYFINVNDGDGAVHLLLKGATIQTAILIDGGREEALDALKATIEEIRQEVGSIFMFDAVVITHWDGDHYRALMSMLYNDLSANEKSTYVKEEAIIYYPHTAANKMSKAKIVVENQYLYFRIQKDADSVKRKLCKVVATTDAIGYDLFRNQAAVTIGNGRFVSSLKEAYNKYTNLLGAKQPVFLIVGADEKFIDGKPSFKRPPDTVKQVKKKGMAKQINAASIMALVIWPTENDKLLRVSLYTGGDAEEERERHLLDWMAKGMDLEKGEVTLDVVKAGHHGSHFAMPETMLNFQNQAFVVSAGEKHGHPSFSVLYFLLMAAEIRKSHGARRVPKVYATRLPYWFDKPLEALTGTHFNIQTVFSYKDGTAEIIKALGELYNDDASQKLIMATFRDAMKHMKNVFFLKYNTRDFEALQEIADGMTTLARFKDWNPPVKTLVADEYKKAVASAKGAIESKWYIHGQPVKTWNNNVGYVYAEATHSEVVIFAKKSLPGSPVASHQFQLVNTKIASLHNKPTIVATSTNARRLADLDDSVTKKRKLNDLIVMATSQTSPAEEWTIRLFMDALLTSHGSGPLPPTFDRVPLDAKSSASYVGSLLDNYFAVTSTIFLSGRSETPGKPELRRIDIELAAKDKAGNSTQTLAFTTDKAIRAAQFGQDAAGAPRTMLGYEERLFGLVLALDHSHTTGGMTLAQFASLIHFPLPGVVDASLGLLALKPVQTPDPEKSQASSSGLWLIPAARGRTILRLAMEPDTNQHGALKVQDFLKNRLGDVEVDKIMVTGICVAETVIEPEEDDNLGKAEAEWNSTLTLQARVKWTSKDTARPVFEGTVAISFTDAGFEIALRLEQKTPDLLRNLVNWVQKKTAAPEESRTNDAASKHQQSTDDVVKMISDALSTLTKGIDVRSVALSFNDQLKPAAFEINIETALSLANGAKAAPFLVSFRWKPGVYRLSAKLWGGLDLYDELPPALYPYWRLAHDIQPRTDKAVFEIPILDLIGQSDLAMPKGIPDTITEAAMRLTYNNGRTTLFIASTIACAPEAPRDDQVQPADPPLLRFNELRLALTLGFQGSKRRDFAVEFDAVTEITIPKQHQPPVTTEQVDDSIILRTKVQYANDESGDSLWTVAGAVENVKVANLFDLFAADGSNSPIMAVMASLHIVYAGVTYEYRSGRPSALYLDGTIRLGPPTSCVQLDLRYSHLGKGSKDPDGKVMAESGWSFSAHLGAAPAQDEQAAGQLFTAADFFTGLVEDVNDMPEIVKNLKIPRDKLGVDLVCSSTSSDNDKHVVFALTITVGTFSMTLAQVRSYGGEGGDKGKGQDTTVPGRLLRFSLSKMPEIPEVPVVGRVDQIPIDQLGVLWTNRDITSKEIAVLNEHVFNEHPLLMKQAKENSETSPKLASGFHFQVALLEGGLPKLVLDHVVGGKKEQHKVNSNNQNIRNANDKHVDGAKPAANNEESTGQSVAPMSKTFGPLSIRSIGLSVEGPKYTIVKLTLDATVRLGPVSFALLDFSLAIDLGSVKSLESLLNLTPAVTVQGMAVAFDKPPTRLAGLISRFEDKTKGSQGFQGAIAVSVAAWSAIAGGRYEELGDGTKSMFVFGMLQGAIAEFGCAEVNGVMGGFGYNSLLRLPTQATDVPKFPFIALNRPDDKGSSGSSVMDQMLMITEGTRDVITAVRDEMWLVAGVGIRAFQLVDAQVLLALTLGAEPKFQLMGTATACFPKSVPGLGAAQQQQPPKQALLVIDIAISAVLDPFHGTFIATGELTPRSFILSPSCRLTGSFAMAYFLPGSSHEGDFVLSVGGYHPRFTPPPQYPVVPSRVGIVWEYDAQLRITGEAYFALSPQAVMAGGRLDMVLDKGWVTVRFSAYADFLMYLHPFAFEADVGIALFASVNLPLLFWTLHLGPLEFAARLVLRGPPVSGEAYLHLWRWDVQVVFGEPPAPVPALTLGEFVRLIKNIPLDADDAAERKVPDLLVSFTAGVVAAAEAAAGGAAAAQTPAPILVRGAQVRFEVQSRMPVLTARVGGYDRDVTIPTPDGKGSTTKPRLFARPMQLTSGNEVFSSKLEVVLKRKGAAEGPEVILDAGPIVKNVPPSIWGEYTGKADMSSLDAKMLQHVMGYSLSVKPKQASEEKLPPICVDTFSAVDVGKTADNRIPAVPPVELLNDDDRFRLVAAGDQSGSQTDAASPSSGPALTWTRTPVVNKHDVFAVWDTFKAACSGGGMRGRQGEGAKLLQTARMMTAR